MEIPTRVKVLLVLLRKSSLTLPRCCSVPLDSVRQVRARPVGFQFLKDFGKHAVLIDSGAYDYQVDGRFGRG